MILLIAATAFDCLLVSSATRPGRVPVPDPQILQVIRVGRLRITGVVIKAVDRVRIEACKPPAGQLVLDRRGDFVAGGEGLCPAIDVEAFVPSL